MDNDAKIIKKITFLAVILAGIIFLAGCSLHWGVGVGGTI